MYYNVITGQTLSLVDWIETLGSIEVVATLIEHGVLLTEELFRRGI